MFEYLLPLSTMVHFGGQQQRDQGSTHSETLEARVMRLNNNICTFSDNTVLEHLAHFMNCILSFCQIQYWSLFVHRGSYIKVHWAPSKKLNVYIVHFCPFNSSSIIRISEELKMRNYMSCDIPLLEVFPSLTH